MPRNIEHLKSSLLLHKVIISLLYFHHQAHTIVAAKESDVLKKIFENYNPVSRPTEGRKTINVRISLAILQLKELNTRYQFISCQGWLRAQWMDECLKWNESEFGGIKQVVVNPGQIWLPAFTLYNTAADHIYDEQWYKLFKAQVRSDGLVKWGPAGKFKASCNIDIKMFPFDDQICFFFFFEWLLSGNYVNLSHSDTAEYDLIGQYMNSNELWDVINASVVTKTQRSLNGDSELYPYVMFTIHLRRKPLLYVTNIILPSLLLAFLVIVAFKLPPESGERISMGMTIFLSFSIFMLMVNDMIPDTSTTIPLITVYIISLMLFTAFSIVETTIVVQIFCYNGSEEIPNWVRCLLCKRLSKSTFEPNRNPLDESFKADHDDVPSEHSIVKQEWQEFARYVDKCCFYVFLVVLLLILFVCLIGVPLFMNVKDFQATIDAQLNQPLH